MATRYDDENVNVEQSELEDQEGDVDNDGSGDADRHEDGDDEYPSFDAEPGEDTDTDLVRKLRAEIRDRDKRLASATRTQQVAEEPIVVGARPKLEDFDYDAEAHDKALDAWEEKRDAKRKQEERIEQAKSREAESWRRVEQNYAAKKAALPYRDKDEAERVAFDALSAAHQAIIADVAPDPALFVYAAGRSPERLNELAGYDMNDPRQVVRMAAAIGRMSASLNMKSKQKPPAPQVSVRGGTARQGGDKELERLEKEADRTGNRTALIKYKRSLAKA